MSGQVGTLKNEQGQKVVLDESETVIGRQRTCGVRLPAEDASVSRRHARIARMSGNIYFVEDLGSSNGTFLNGRRLPPHQMIPLEAGSHLQIGRYYFVFQFESAPLPSAQAMVPRVSISWPHGQKEAMFSGQSMTIGREPSCDLPVPWDKISRQHACIECTSQGYQIVDAGSANGVWYQGQRIQSQAIRPGDQFALGSEVQLQIDFVPVTDTAAEPVQRLVPITGKPVMTIGRSRDNDLVISHPQVSRHHARLQHVGQRFLLSDLNSTHGTFVNGRRIRGEVEVTASDDIRLAGQRITLAKTISGQMVLGRIHEGGNIRLDANNLWKAVGTGSNAKTILREISLSILPGEFITLVGVSGAGKSTLLRALSGFAPASFGRVYYNGRDYYTYFDSYRNSVGYVPQREIIHMELPARQALLYAARLRFPADTLKFEMEKRVDEVLKLLGIWGRKDVPVGNLSGGQQKRVSIAVELLTEPALLFLDEPTSGLDPGYEKKMMQELRKMANEGQTIILVTHNILNIGLCDQIAFLSHGGRLAYYGPPEQICSYFRANDLADIYTRLEGHPEEKDLPRQTPDDNTLERNSRAWHEHYRSSPLYRQYVTSRQQDIQAHSRRAGHQPALTGRARISGLRQFFILCQRYVEIICRDQRNLLLLLLQAPILSLILAQVFDPDILTVSTMPDASRGRAMALLFLLCVISIWLGTSNSCREIVKELPIYLRERAVNLKLLPYVMSKVVVLTLFSLFQSLMLLGIVAIRIDFPDNIPNLFAKALFTLVLTSLAGTTMGLLISAFSPNANRAVSLVPLLLIPQIIFAGMILPLEDMGKFGEVVAPLMISRWSFVVLGTIFDVERIELAPCPGMPLMPYGEDPHGPFTVTVSHYWWALLAFALVFISLTIYFQKKKDVRRRS